jgi:hypothetical protein
MKKYICTCDEFQFLWRCTFSVTLEEFEKMKRFKPTPPDKQNQGRANKDRKDKTA